MTRRNKEFVARLRICGKVTHLGVFANEVQAAEAYNVAVKKYRGNDSKINIIKEK